MNWRLLLPSTTNPWQALRHASDGTANSLSDAIIWFTILLGAFFLLYALAQLVRCVLRVDRYLRVLSGVRNREDFAEQRHQPPPAVISNNCQAQQTRQTHMKTWGRVRRRLVDRHHVEVKVRGRPSVQAVKSVEAVT